MFRCKNEFNKKIEEEIHEASPTKYNTQQKLAPLPSSYNTEGS